MGEKLTLDFRVYKLQILSANAGIELNFIHVKYENSIEI